MPFDQYGATPILEADDPLAEQLTNPSHKALADSLKTYLFEHAIKSQPDRAHSVDILNDSELSIVRAKRQLPYLFIKIYSKNDCLQVALENLLGDRAKSHLQVQVQEPDTVTFELTLRIFIKLIQDNPSFCTTICEQRRSFMPGLGYEKKCSDGEIVDGFRDDIHRVTFYLKLIFSFGATYEDQASFDLSHSREKEREAKTNERALVGRYGSFFGRALAGLGVKASAETLEQAAVASPDPS